MGASKGEMGTGRGARFGKVMGTTVGELGRGRVEKWWEQD